MLRYAARLLGDGVGLADEIEESGFAVINVTQNCDNGRTLDGMFGTFLHMRIVEPYKA